MMHPYPFFGTSYYRRPYTYYSYRRPSHNENKNCDFNERKPCFPNAPTKQEQGNFSCSSNASNCSNSSGFSNVSNCSNASNCSKNKDCKFNNIENFQSDDEECFEIFGLKLHFDDLLIIALLFFLYQEDVKDTYLYITLILLLLS